MSKNVKFLCFGKEVINVNYIKNIRCGGSSIEIEFTDGVTRYYEQSSIEKALDSMLFLLRFFEHL